MTKRGKMTAALPAFVLAALTAPVPAFAADAPTAATPKTSDADGSMTDRMAAASRLMEVIHADRQLDAIMPQIINLLMGSLANGNTGHESQIKTILTEEFAAAFAGQKGAFIESTREIYAKDLTLAEIKAMTDFYSTPIGQAVLAKQPVISQDSLQGGAEIGRKAAQTALPRIIQRMQEAKLETPKGT
jgi:uncharacterized protein